LCDCFLVFYRLFVILLYWLLELLHFLLYRLICFNFLIRLADLIFLLGLIHYFRSLYFWFLSFLLFTFFDFLALFLFFS